MNGGILILVEHLKGNISEITYEMINMGKKIARESNQPLFALLIGNNTTSLISNIGQVNKLYVFDDPKIQIPHPGLITLLIEELLKTNPLSIILLGGTNISAGVGPVLSSKIGYPFLNFAKNISIVNNNITVTSQLFGGKILSNVELPENKGIISIYPGSFSSEKTLSPEKPEIITLKTAGEGIGCEFLKFIEPDAGDIDITKQDILISIGRGIESQDNISLAEDLKDLLGGAVCASRPVIDQGWLLLSRQVGKSGMNVKPKLYLALGISGAPEHVEGMKDSELIIAINKDPDAPIFNVAQYGACADINDVVPQLIDQIKQRKGGN